MADKPYREMTDDELRTAFKLWDDAYENAPGWGAAVAFADSQRKQCRSLLQQRGIEREPAQ